MNINENLEQKLNQLGQTITPGESLVDNVMHRIEQLPAAPPRTRNIRITILKSNWTKIAASVIMALGITSMILVFTSTTRTSLVFSEVVSPFVNARTITFDLIIQSKYQDGPPSRYSCILPGRIRQELSDGTVTIIDYREDVRKVLILDTNRMEATIRSPHYTDNGQPVFDLDDIIDKVKAVLTLDEDQIEFLGEQEIAGRIVSCFQVQIYGNNNIFAWQGRGTFTVWADPETHLPLQLELYDEMTQLTTLISNIIINADLDENLFSQEIPEGYTLLDEQENQENITITPPAQPDEIEQKIIDGLYAWTSLTDGKFPSELSVRAAKDIDPNATYSFKQEGWGFQFYVSLPSYSSRLGKLYQKDYVPTEQEKKEMEVFQQTMKDIFALFASIHSQRDWSYAGRDVLLGDADTPIFWYRPDGSKTYRVIYADLTVEDAAPDDLPVPKEDQETSER